MKRIGWLAVALVLLGSLALARQEEEPIVSVKVVPSAEPFKAGSSYVLTLEISIRSPYHINADQPSEDFLIGTTIEFKPVAGVAFGKPEFPSPEIMKFELSEKPLAVFIGTVKVTAGVKIAPDFKGSEVTVEGLVGYQACDDRSCLPPKEASFNRKIAVRGGAPSAPAAGGTATKAPEGKAPEKAAEGAPAKPEAAKEEAAAETAAPAAGKTGALEGKGLPAVFLLVFLGGLALNLTPCIYPMIPITISYFGGQAQGKKGGAVLHAIIYVIGMAATYSILGVLAAFTGSLFGTALQVPAVLVAIAVVMLALALSMFDVYEFRMPAFLNRLAGGSQKGYFGTFFMGLTVGIVAAPCIGPFVLGLLTYVGNKGNVVLGFSLFFVLALGLGLPFLVLGIFSGSLNRLPRSGAWMVWVRKLFGFVLVGMAAYFVKSLLPSPVYFSVAVGIIALIAGIYMAWIEATPVTGKAFRAVRSAFGVLFFLIALVALASGVRNAVDEGVAAKLSASGGGPAANVMAWAPYSEDRLAQAVRDGKPVFIDTFADWCIPCKELDKKTFSQPDVIAASRGFVLLKANITNDKDAWVKAFEARFGIRGVPTLIFLKPDGTEIAELRGTGFEPVEVFLPKMRKALELSGSVK